MEKLRVFSNKTKPEESRPIRMIRGDGQFDIGSVENGNLYGFEGLLAWDFILCWTYAPCSEDTLRSAAISSKHDASVEAATERAGLMDSAAVVDKGATT